MELLHDQCSPIWHTEKDHQILPINVFLVVERVFNIPSVIAYPQFLHQIECLYMTNAKYKLLVGWSKHINLIHQTKLMIFCLSDPDSE